MVGEFVSARLVVKFVCIAPSNYLKFNELCL
jgi:hypothetical protein